MAAATSQQWSAALRSTLSDALGGDTGSRIFDDWFATLPLPYRDGSDPKRVAHLLCALDTLRQGRTRLAIVADDDGEAPRLVLIHVGARLELSYTMPFLTNLGFHVVEESTDRVSAFGQDFWVHDFGVRLPAAAIQTPDAARRIEKALEAIHDRRAESDPLNRLLLVSTLDWRHISILAAYRRYRHIVGSRFSESQLTDVLTAHPLIVAKLMALFDMRFDPARAADEHSQGKLRHEIRAALDEVASPDDDRILRDQLALIEATKRTNVFRDGARSIAFKFRSDEVPGAAAPKPLFEIFVHAREVEGIHLRGNEIARGGIRWSDRSDYRTEVHGLMRAQMTKNAAIAPDGAKGGFYIRHHLGEESASVQTAFTIFISGLLDLTDNIVDGTVVHPRDVRALDSEDPYLVVAADKGTAALSDLANEIADEYGFWLGDAFASGGSKGYGHKQLGITARGAWVSMRRHLTELGIDPDTGEFTIIGIGDMSGDVFGNALIRSSSLRLIAAFDHRHIFLDPNPDPVVSAAERRRLFECPGSSWDDYERTLISPGGGVWSRRTKRVELDDTARTVLGVTAEALTPDDLIRAILQCRVDVVFNGGVGTFVKASDEHHSDAKDRTNDLIRVDADQLRCRSVVEGGNLGLTQRARIEFARGGGLVYADFVDNSAAVTCSDYEVNLKILLGTAVEQGTITAARRDDLLASLTDEVCARVLQMCGDQADAIRRHAARSGGALLSYEDFMAALEASGALRRVDEALPVTEELADRRREGLGLMLPEVAVIAAHAKRSLAQSLKASTLPDDPHLATELWNYFPARAVESCGRTDSDHPLRRQLVATLVSNRLVNVMGPTFAWRLAAELGVELADIVRGFLIAQALLDPTARDATWGIDDGIDWLLEAFTRWYVQNPVRSSIETVVTRDAPGLHEILSLLPEIGAPSWRHERRQAALDLQARGVPAEIARIHAYRKAVVHGPDMLAVARSCGRELRDVGHAFFLLGDHLPLAWMEQEAARLSVSTRHQRWTVNAICDDVLQARRRLAVAALAEESDSGTADEALTRFLSRRHKETGRLLAYARGSTADGDSDLASLVLATRQLTALSTATA